MKEPRGRKDAEEVNLRAGYAESKLKEVQDLIWLVIVLVSCSLERPMNSPSGIGSNPPPR